MIRRTAAVVFVMVTFAATSALAAEPRDSRTPATVDAAAAAQIDTPTAADANLSFSPKLEPSPSSRPALLPALYVSFAALQAYDAHSTITGLRNGAREANPIARSIVGSPATFWTVKAATAGASIFMAEKMWKKSKTAAIVTMAVANGVSALVAARNASVLKQIR